MVSSKNFLGRCKRRFCLVPTQLSVYTGGTTLGSATPSLLDLCRLYICKRSYPRAGCVLICSASATIFYDAEWHGIFLKWKWFSQAESSILGKLIHERSWAPTVSIPCAFHLDLLEAPFRNFERLYLSVPRGTPNIYALIPTLRQIPPLQRFSGPENDWEMDGSSAFLWS